MERNLVCGLDQREKLASVWKASLTWWCRARSLVQRVHSVICHSSLIIAHSPPQVCSGVIINLFVQFIYHYQYFLLPITPHTDPSPSIIPPFLLWEGEIVSRYHHLRSLTYLGTSSNGRTSDTPLYSTEARPKAQFGKQNQQAGPRFRDSSLLLLLVNLHED